MEHRSPARSRSSKALLALVLLLGCGPRVVEDNTDFIEERCEIWCDGSCEHTGLTWAECFDDCTESPSWTENCLEDRAVYHECILELSCSERAELAERGIAGENGPEDACYEELHEASICRYQ